MAAEVARRRGGNGCKDADAVAEAVPVARRRTARRMKALDVRGRRRSGEKPGDGDGGGEAMARWAAMQADCGCGCMLHGGGDVPTKRGEFGVA